MKKLALTAALLLAACAPEGDALLEADAEQLFRTSCPTLAGDILDAEMELAGLQDAYDAECLHTTMSGAEIHAQTLDCLNRLLEIDDQVGVLQSLQNQYHQQCRFGMGR